MSEEDKKKLIILGVLAGVFLVICIPLYILPALHKGDAEGPEAPPEYADNAGVPGEQGEEGSGDEEEYSEEDSGSLGGDEMSGQGETSAAASAIPEEAKGAPYFDWRADPFAPIGVGFGDLDTSQGRRNFPSVPSTDRVENIGYLPAVPTFRSGPSAVPRNVSEVLPEEDLSKAGDKRMSGVAYNDSVWAVLEVGTGESEPASYVVKPGDTVENIRVQSVERSRIIIRDEENKLKEVELRKAPPKTQETGEGYEEGYGEETYYDEEGYDQGGIMMDQRGGGGGRPPVRRPPMAGRRPPMAGRGG